MNALRGRGAGARQARARAVQPRRRGLALPLVCVAALGLARTDGAGAPGDARRQMHRIFEALRTLLPTALADSGWATARAPAAALAGAAEALTTGAAAADPSYRLLSRSLVSDAHWLREQLERGRDGSAAFFSERIAETCIACHLRLPASRTDDFPQALLQGTDAETVSPFARAKLHTAAGQFEAALQTYERAFAEPRAPLEPLELSDALRAYLILALRVRRDPARAERGLERLAQQPGLPAPLARDLPIWRRALRELGPCLHEPPTLARARDLLARGRALRESLDAAGQVHAIAASALLFRYLAEERPTGDSRAAALLLLAQTGAFTRRAFEVSEAEAYLEQAIEAAPHTPIAEAAYARLATATRGRYAERTPDDVRLRLQELRVRSRARRRGRAATPRAAAAQ